MKYRQPGWIRGRIGHRIIGPVHRRFYTDRGTAVTNREWDVLVVLDGCREDLFQREFGNGSRFDTYDSIESVGSATDEWVRNTFDADGYPGTIYVTANPVVSREIAAPFFGFVEVWRDEFDGELGTVPAPAVTEAAIDIAERHPDKRLIVHYLQPHYPFVTRPNLQFTNFGGTSDISFSQSNNGAGDVWEALANGLVSEGDVWQGYTENLQYVMKSVDRLIDHIPGRIAITSDHGNLLGERPPLIPIRQYGHPPGVYHRWLRDVPWAVIENGQRAVSTTPNADVERQLRRLGYAD